MLAIRILLFIQKNNKSFPRFGTDISTSLMSLVLLQKWKTPSSNKNAGPRASQLKCLFRRISSHLDAVLASDVKLWFKSHGCYRRNETTNKTAVSGASQRTVRVLLALSVCASGKERFCVLSGTAELALPWKSSRPIRLQSPRASQ